MECQATYNRMKHAGVNSQCTQALASLFGGMYMEDFAQHRIKMPPVHRHGLCFASHFGTL